MVHVVQLTFILEERTTKGNRNSSSSSSST
jgi:hypothetical protein